MDLNNRIVYRIVYPIVYADFRGELQKFLSFFAFF